METIGMGEVTRYKQKKNGNEDEGKRGRNVNGPNKWNIAQKVVASKSTAGSTAIYGWTNSEQSEEKFPRLCL